MVDCDARIGRWMARMGRCGRAMVGGGGFICVGDAVVVVGLGSAVGDIAQARQSLSAGRQVHTAQHDPP